MVVGVSDQAQARFPTRPKDTFPPHPLIILKKRRGGAQRGPPQLFFSIIIEGGAGGGNQHKYAFRVTLPEI